MLPKKHKLNSFEFSEVVSKGKQVSVDTLSLRFLTSPTPHPQFAVAVGKKISASAFKRNKIKRQVFSCLEIEIQKIKPNTKAVVFVKKNTEDKNLFCQDLERLLSKAKFLT